MYKKSITLFILLLNAFVGKSQCDYNNPDGSFAAIESVWISEEDLDSLGGCYTYPVSDFPTCLCFDYKMGSPSESYLFRFIFKATSSGGDDINESVYFQSNESGAHSYYDFVSDNSFVISEAVYDSEGNVVVDSASYVYGDYYQEGDVFTLCIQFDTVGLNLKDDVKICMGSNGENNTLPVEFINVEAKGSVQSPNIVNINWTTASEINNEKFIVQKSKDVNTWVDFAEVSGSGNSNLVLSYEVNDTNPFADITYYRIKQIDFDGKFSFSKIVSFKKDIELENNHIKIYPNPAKHFVNIKNNSGKSENIEITNLSGNILYKNTIVKSLQIDISKFESGVYIVMLGNNKNKLIVIN